jgi:hypothetical protein
MLGSLAQGRRHVHISEAQIDKLSTVREREFVQRLCAHGQEHFPSSCAKVSTAELEEVTSRIVRDAREQGLESERAICLYYNVALSLGITFLTNSLIPWSSDIVRMSDEPPEPDWITRVAGIATRTLRDKGF